MEISGDGVWIQTERSQNQGGPQLVPAWMINAGWRMLVERGEVRSPELVKVAKRSSAVHALLAQVPGVEVVSTRPIVLRGDRRG